jgi:arylsulfatase A-like enzyme
MKKKTVKRLQRALLAGIAIGAALAPTAAGAQQETRYPGEIHQAPPDTTPAPPTRTSGPPNVILILADDIGIEGFNTYGGQYYTPNIDQLAIEGTRFQNAHSMPLCSPSRVQLMTGLDNWRNYEAFGYLAPGQRTFGNVMKDAGYVTGMVGKWQLMGNGFDGRVGITPEAAGFDESYLWQLEALDKKGSRYWGPTRAHNGHVTINEEGFGPDFDAAYALNFIHRHRDKPFFLYYAMVLVHNPFVPTPDSMTATGLKTRFSGMVSYLDREVGDVMAQLRRDGLDKNTIVIFTGDNGTNQKITSTRDGYQIKGGKGLPTIDGTHVPMIAWAPGRVPAGKTTDALIDFADILPTIASIADHPVDPKSTDGVNQWPVMEGKQASARDMIFEHYAPAWQFPPARYAFDAHWKLYGDGRFVKMDTESGVETEIAPNQRTGEAAKHYAALARLMKDTPDGPLDQTRFPWCTGKPSKDPKLPATVAGCNLFPGGEE